jgi:hypothetical protein
VYGRSGGESSTRPTITPPKLQSLHNSSKTSSSGRPMTAVSCATATRANTTTPQIVVAIRSANPPADRPALRAGRGSDARSASRPPTPVRLRWRPRC